EKVSIIVSKGSLEGIYPALIMANGARAEGIEASLFFTFFGLDAISRKRHQHIKMAAVGNPGLHLATLAGALPGMPGLMTSYLERKMGKLDIPPIPEFIEMIADTGSASTAARHPATCSGSPKMTSSSRSRTSSRWASSMPPRPEARSSSPDRVVCPHRGVGSVTAAKPGSQYPRGYTWVSSPKRQEYPCAAQLSATVARRPPGLAAASMRSRPSPGSRLRTAVPAAKNQPQRQ